MTGAQYREARADAGLTSSPEIPYPYQPPGKASAPFDPLRLCIFTTISLLGWLLGPFAVVVFAVIGVVGYLSARRAGLLSSRCLLGDTRLVIGYLSLIGLAGVVGIVFKVQGWL